MKVRFMQSVDYWVGVPLCALLTALDLVLRLFRRVPSTPPKKLLFIELSEMGSAILAYSSLVRAQQFPDAELWFLIFRSNRESVSVLNLIPEHRILTIENRSFLRFAITAAQALWRVRREGFDTVVDLELFSRFTMMFSYLSGADRRVGFSNFSEEGLYRGDLLTHRVFYNGLHHISTNFLALVHSLTRNQEEIELKANVQSSRIPLPHIQISRQEQHLLYSRIGVDTPHPERRLILLNPDPGALPLRAWPVEHYIELVREVSRSVPDIDFGVVGLASSRVYAEQIAAACPDAAVYDLTGTTADLRELLVLLSGAAAFVTSDSGPAHMAALVRIPLFVFFGPESPVRYQPLHERMWIYYAGLSCSPCYSAQNHRHSVCRNNVCMQQLPVSAVSGDLIRLFSAGSGTE